MVLQFSNSQDIDSILESLVNIKFAYPTNIKKEQFEVLLLSKVLLHQETISYILSHFEEREFFSTASSMLT